MQLQKLEEQIQNPASFDLNTAYMCMIISGTPSDCNMKKNEVRASLSLFRKKKTTVCCYLPGGSLTGLVYGCILSILIIWISLLYTGKCPSLVVLWSLCKYNLLLIFAKLDMLVILQLTKSSNKYKLRISNREKNKTNIQTRNSKS